MNHSKFRGDSIRPGRLWGWCAVKLAAIGFGPLGKLFTGAKYVDELPER